MDCLATASPGRAPVSITPPRQAAVRLNVVVPVIRAGRHAAPFLDSPAPKG